MLPATSAAPPMTQGNLCGDGVQYLAGCCTRGDPRRIRIEASECPRIPAFWQVSVADQFDLLRFIVMGATVLGEERIPFAALKSARRDVP